MESPPVLVGEAVWWLGSGSGLPARGVVRWIGRLAEMGPGWALGLELEEALPYGGVEGTWRGRRLFQCRPRHGLVVPWEKVVPTRSQSVGTASTASTTTDKEQGLLGFLKRFRRERQAEEEVEEVCGSRESVWTRASFSWVRGAPCRQGRSLLQREEVRVYRGGLADKYGLVASSSDEEHRASDSLPARLAAPSRTRSRRAASEPNKKYHVKGKRRAPPPPRLAKKGRAPAPPGPPPTDTLRLERGLLKPNMESKCPQVVRTASGASPRPWYKRRPVRPATDLQEEEWAIESALPRGGLLGPSALAQPGHSNRLSLLANISQLDREAQQILSRSPHPFNRFSASDLGLLTGVTEVSVASSKSEEVPEVACSSAGPAEPEAQASATPSTSSTSSPTGSPGRRVWTCTRCTLDNARWRLTCEACDAWRPTVCDYRRPESSDQTTEQKIKQILLGPERPKLDPKTAELIRTGSVLASKSPLLARRQARPSVPTKPPDPQEPPSTQGPSTLTEDSDVVRKARLAYFDKSSPPRQTTATKQVQTTNVQSASKTSSSEKLMLRELLKEMKDSLPKNRNEPLASSSNVSNSSKTNHEAALPRISSKQTNNKILTDTESNLANGLVAKQVSVKVHIEADKSELNKVLEDKELNTNVFQKPATSKQECSQAVKDEREVKELNDGRSKEAVRQVNGVPHSNEIKVEIQVEPSSRSRGVRPKERDVTSDRSKEVKPEVEEIVKEEDGVKPVKEVTAYLVKRETVFEEIHVKGKVSSAAQTSAKVVEGWRERPPAPVEELLANGVGAMGARHSGVEVKIGVREVNGGLAESGGVQAGTSGLQSRTSGVLSGTNGVQAGTSGLQSRTSGVLSGTNGVQAGTSGLQSRISGVLSGTNGVQAGTSGLQSRTSEVLSGTNAAHAGTSGLQSRTSGVLSGTNGVQAGTSGLHSRSSGAQAGTSGVEASTSGEQSGLGGVWDKEQPAPLAPPSRPSSINTWAARTLNDVDASSPPGSPQAESSRLGEMRKDLEAAISRGEAGTAARLASRLARLSRLLPAHHSLEEGGGTLSPDDNVEAGELEARGGSPDGDVGPRSSSPSLPSQYAATALSHARLHKREEVYKRLVALEREDLVPSEEGVECPVCLEDTPPGQPVLLRDCLHAFCRSCLREVVRSSGGGEVRCPYIDSNYSCQAFLQDREIKALVTREEYEDYLAKSVSLAEAQAENAFHCKTPDCKGWCFYEDRVNTFLCPVCTRTNCLTCQVIHEGLDCKQYQHRLELDSPSDSDAKRTQLFLQEMVVKGEGMECPGCGVVLVKKWGCDWLRCSVCRTEICWVTRGPRWGPQGKGDTSGGCRCGVDGVKCHPRCTYCH